MWSKKFIWKSANITNSITRWKGMCGKTVPKYVEIAILSLPSSSTATERSISSYSDVTAKRNRLTEEKAGKLTCVKHNLKLKIECEAENKNDKEAETKDMIVQINLDHHLEYLIKKQKKTTQEVLKMNI